MHNEDDANGTTIDAALEDIELVEEEAQAEVFVEPTIDVKFQLVIKACETLTEIESLGNLKSDFQPKRIEISTFNYDDLISTKIKLMFDERVAEPSNWSGMGYTIGEALTANLWCLRFETERRIAKLQALLAELSTAAPIKERGE